MNVMEVLGSKFIGRLDRQNLPAMRVYLYRLNKVWNKAIDVSGGSIVK